MNSNYKAPRLRHGWATLLASLSIVVGTQTNNSAQAAEKIQFNYGPAEATVYVDDLAKLAETGQVSDRLSNITRRLSPEQLSSLQSFLDYRFDVSPVMMSQFAYSPIGQTLIQRMGQVLQTDSLKNGFSAIRAGLILATTEEDGLTAMNFLQEFPLETIQVDLPLTLKILAENREIYQQRDAVLTQLRQVATAQSSKVELPSKIDLSQPGPYSWQVETFRFQNPSRTDSSVISMADLYLPDFPAERPEKAPIIVISHGAASNRQTLAYLANHFASHGYAVVIPEHPETTSAQFVRFFSGFEGAPAAASLLYRPLDITVALNTLEEQALQDSALQALDFETVGVLGQSMGGFTALAAAGAQLNNQAELEQVCNQNLKARPQLNLSVLLQCRLLDIPSEQSLQVADNRIQAAIAINPLSRYVFGQSGLNALDKPTLIVAGLEDYFTPAIPEQITPFSWIAADEKYLLAMEKGTHFSFLVREGKSVFSMPDALLGPKPEVAQTLFKTLALAFFNAHLQSQSEAEAYLDQSYLDTLELQPFRFSLVRNPASLPE